jgi:hypothetical protein
MIEFFAWLVLVCVVPFVIAMLELQFKESKRRHGTSRSNAAAFDRPSLIIGFKAEQRGHELVRVVHATGLTARWRDRCSSCARSEGAPVLKDLVLHEIGLPSAPIGKKMRRSVALNPYWRQHQDPPLRSGWTSLN